MKIYNNTNITYSAIEHNSRKNTKQNVPADLEKKMTQTEYNIIAALSEHAGKVMTYSAIIKEIWGYNDEGSIKKLQVNMVNIRKKLGARPGEKNYIVNELGVGYRMCEADEETL